jgi:hypothetical protein
MARSKRLPRSALRRGGAIDDLGRAGGINDELEQYLRRFGGQWMIIGT